jgi:hypothetical protein
MFTFGQIIPLHRCGRGYEKAHGAQDELIFMKKGLQRVKFFAGP